MENYSNEIFGFGNTANEELEQSSNFNFDSISGLGQSDYENEDLFSTEVETNTIPVFDNYNTQETINNIEKVNDVGINYVESNDLIDSISQNVSRINFDPMTGQPLNEYQPQVNTDFEQKDVFIPEESNEINDFVYENPTENSTPIEEPIHQSTVNIFEQPVPEIVPIISEQVNQTLIDSESVTEEEQVPPIGPGLPGYVEMQPEVEELNISENKQVVEQQIPDVTPEKPEQSNSVLVDPEPVIEEIIEQPVVEEEKEEITISETPIEELNKLTEFKEEKIEETDINSLFDKVSVNVKDASDIFRKNTDLKQKIDIRFEELKKLQSELENSRKKQLDEINKYKEEVLDKLTEKKEEIERRLNILKESQATLEKEKKEFEEYKKKEQENIDRVQKEVQSAYDDRREELNHIEDVLRKQKDSLDEERSQLSLDRIQYESDKNELANNLLKFNDLVNSFTNGVNDIKE